VDKARGGIDHRAGSRSALRNHDNYDHGCADDNDDYRCADDDHNYNDDDHHHDIATALMTAPAVRLR
jgi:hypothetical protein